MYSVERKNRNSINWVCSKNSNLALRCPARCVTNQKSTTEIKLSDRHHNHPTDCYKLHKRPSRKGYSKRRSSSIQNYQQEQLSHITKSELANCRNVHRQPGFRIINGYRFVIGTSNQRRTYLKCANFRSNCRARAIVNKDTNQVRMRHEGHNRSCKDSVGRRSAKK
ncbi:uncharacterized protein LOC108098510 isoform X2 [Drosophila ficusphila]|nr:uncharacterized protein LOC108098510 isoform X2 [Drosophila ficusphila]